MNEIKSNIQRIKSEKDFQNIIGNDVEMKKKWLIIFDIDNTLLHYDLITNKPTIRPFVFQFIKEFENECEFALWTKGDRLYADMMSKMFNVSKWLFVWSREDCSFDTKPLEKVTFRFPIYNQTNTIFIDDLSSNFELNDGWYCILVPPFIGDPFDRIFEHLILKIRNDLIGYKNINNMILEDYNPYAPYTPQFPMIKEPEMLKMAEELLCGTIVIWHN